MDFIELKNTFGGSPINRNNNERKDESYIANKKQSENFAILVFNGKGQPLVVNCNKLFWINKIQYKKIVNEINTESVEADENLFYLGEWNDQEHNIKECFTKQFQNENIFEVIQNVVGQSVGIEFKNLREICISNVIISAEESAIGAHAQALIAFHKKHKYCGTCGSLTKVFEGGCKRTCQKINDKDCKAEWFPRTDPVAICAVIDIKEKKILLGRKEIWPKGLYSCLAGFMEHESIEDAARREVFEESGVVLNSVRYVSSQPWPFPYSLMIGCIGQADSILPVVVDKDELEDARWFEMSDVKDLLEPSALYQGDLPTDNDELLRKSSPKNEHVVMKLPPRGTISNQIITKAIELFG